MYLSFALNIYFDLLIILLIYLYIYCSSWFCPFLFAGDVGQSNINFCLFKLCAFTKCCRMDGRETAARLYGEYTYENLERESYWPSEKLRISITGAGGFIASHIARRLKSEGHYIIASDWKKNEHMPEDMFCHEFHLVDLRVMDNCLKVTQGVDHVFNLAADMGGMGFIQSNHSVIMYNNTMISFNMLEASRISGVKRFATFI